MLKSDGRYEPGKTYTVREDFEGKVNHPVKEIHRQVKENIRRQHPQATIWPANDYKAMLLCGGPSLDDYVSVIKRKRTQGWKLFTVNGTHGWAQSHGLSPSAQIMLDARAHNARFVERPVKKCRYFIEAQCHGSVFDALEGYDIHVWHSANAAKPERDILSRYHRGRVSYVNGGCSVGTRAMCLAYMIGIRRLDVYGMDGCLIKGRHHAYEQKENDGQAVHTVRVGRKHFYLHPWMVKQLDEWLQMPRLLPDDFRLTMHGPGVLAYVIEETVRRGRVPPMHILEVK